MIYAICCRVILLNGKALQMTGSQDLPALNPVRLQTDSIYLPPKSIGFHVVYGLKAPVC